MTITRSLHSDTTVPNQHLYFLDGLPGILLQLLDELLLISFNTEVRPLTYELISDDVYGIPDEALSADSYFLGSQGKFSYIIKGSY